MYKCSKLVRDLDFDLFHTFYMYHWERKTSLFQQKNGKKSFSYNITPVIYIAGSFNTHAIHYGRYI